MSKLTELINSLNDENVEEIREQLISEASVRDKTSKQLYSRTKKAEGFELNKATGKWSKKESKKEINPKADKKAVQSELDYGQLAFHNSKSNSFKIENDADIEHLQNIMNESGKSQNEILGSKWFQADVKERQEARSVKDAIPSNSKRSPSSGTKDNVDYWLAKGQLPPDRALREKVVNAKIAKETSADNSSEGSVVTNTSGVEIK